MGAKTIAKLAKEQGVKPVTDVDTLRGPDWSADIGIGDVVAALNDGKIATRPSMRGAWLAREGDAIHMHYNVDNNNLLSHAWQPTTADILATDWIISERYEIVRETSDVWRDYFRAEKIT